LPSCKQATGQLTARRLAEMYLERIQFLDQRDHDFNAVLEINPDALAIADALDQERKDKGPLGPLHAIPLLLLKLLSF
jgi:amidase